MGRDSRLSRPERLRTAIEAIDWIDAHLAGMDESAFLASRLHRDAVCMEVIQIAEMLKPLDDADESFRDHVPEVGSVLGMRNVIAHQYQTINDRIVWDVATHYLPSLRQRLETLLRDG